MHGLRFASALGLACVLCACSTSPATHDAMALDAFDELDAASDLGESNLDAGLLCPSDLPSSCPVPEPSYANAVADVIAQRCVPCHQPGGVAASKPLTTYADVYARRSAVLNQVYGCVMPPPDAGALDPSERHDFLAWLVCGAPSN